MNMQNPSHLLTSRGVDQLEGEHLAAYNDVRKEFMRAFEIEEKLKCGTSWGKENLLRTRAMKRA